MNPSYWNIDYFFNNCMTREIKQKVFPVTNKAFSHHTCNMTYNNHYECERKSCPHIRVEWSQIVMQCRTYKPNPIKNQSKKIREQNKSKKSSEHWKIESRIFFIANCLSRKGIKSIHKIKSHAFETRKSFCFNSSIENCYQTKKHYHKNPSRKNGIGNRNSCNFPELIPRNPRNMRTRMCRLSCGFERMSRCCRHKINTFSTEVYKNPKKNQIFLNFFSGKIFPHNFYKILSSDTL